jgi:N-acetylneuraminic acid mutarotase
MALVLCWSAPSLAGSGGPDRGGYEWIDTLEPSSPVTYGWIDISATGTPVTLTEDGESAEIPIGFNFDFYGVTYANVRIGANGYITFMSNTYTGIPRHCPLPAVAAPNAAVFGFYQDWDPTEAATGGVYYETIDAGGTGVLVVTFDNIEIYQGDPAFGSDPATFQILLDEATGSIMVNVADSGGLAGGPRWTYNTVIGIENDTGTIGTGHCPGAIIPDGYAAQFRLSSGYGLYPDTQLVAATPGAATAVDLDLVNFSGTQETASVAVTPDGSWAASPSSPSVVVAADGGTSTVTIDITPPAGAAAGDRDSFTVTVTIGGEDLSAEIEAVATFPDDDWQVIQDLPRALQDIQMVADDDFLYVMGGSYLDTGTDQWIPLATTYRWSPDTNYWNDGAMADLPGPVTAGSACYMDGHIYFVGGFDGAATDGSHWSFNTDLYIYEVASDTWTTAAPPTRAMAYANIACHDASNRVYVFNGYVDLDDNGEYIYRTDGGLDWTEPQTLIYSADSDVWSEGTAASDGVSGSGTAAIGNNILVAGGFFDDEADPAHSGWVTRGLRIYNTLGDSWSSGGWLSSYTSRTAGVVLDDQFCVVAGRHSDPIGTWECYSNPDWIMQVDQMSLPRESIGAAVLGGHIYVVAGDAGGWVTDRSERWPTAALTPPLIPDDDPDSSTEDDVEPIPDGYDDADVIDDPAADPGTDTDTGGKSKGCGCTIAY